MDMKDQAEPGMAGKFEARYLAFLETISQLRPRLHRYCSRMTGSVIDGEDVVQEALFEAYRKLDQFDDNRPLAPWLFRRPKARGRGESELKQSERRIRRSGLFTQELRLHHCSLGATICDVGRLAKPCYTNTSAELAVQWDPNEKGKTRMGKKLLRPFVL